ncbi:hypothetical protein A2715_05625 [Candidatus Woesebacteria bacterium RIFCSPHIGHO2_01_FULL_39_32]|uniref:Methyltransferase type 11 domain-containing protein n=1 Tax=Candidatus Woesebacteria bacterium RIFCSPLOWO2_01_FULL_39_25 TaxID=1802521 RepID=A0A1F8BM54_9BACT|nr:MAG: hypothetical protein A2124_04070 [Candidatus Woesebacteria bacterium GWB1_37_5]OGM25499.1 MAG: hypothetical protein A2715_05625 [Candidatus Woesebacteria bacterium RIFCSPHIGHO2_01_FULL_39_32]OGM36779.1 MAG: hypothetical protein A3F01_00095 [Candidatus Woesebacteria bacterium RIFCSPHIGHO2_12_FULL_38_11]OGM65030.1 MAG: hypothetical protein A2893_05235 [Candidatus Woesebacteria bacterium RIFCSPLOWO2_01_FULL_39_25]
MEIPKDPFRLDELRNELAFRRKLKELKATYSKRFPEIPDWNTPTLWDKLNPEYIVTKESNPIAYDRFRTFTKLLKKIKGKVVDVGAGSGVLEGFIEKEGLNLDWYGVDIAPKSIQQLKKKYPYWNFSIGDAKKLPFKNNLFDCVIVSEVLEHIPPKYTFKALSEVQRVLKHNGKLIISVPLNEGLPEMIKKGINPNAHTRAYTIYLLKAELELAGFKVDWQKELYAFSNNYTLKTFIVKYVLPGIRQPNNVILLARKI